MFEEIYPEFAGDRDLDLLIVPEIVPEEQAPLIAHVEVTRAAGTDRRERIAAFGIGVCMNKLALLVFEEGRPRRESQRVRRAERDRRIRRTSEALARLAGAVRLETRPPKHGQVIVILTRATGDVCEEDGSVVARFNAASGELIHLGRPLPPPEVRAEAYGRK